MHNVKFQTFYMFLQGKSSFVKLKEQISKTKHFIQNTNYHINFRAKQLYLLLHEECDDLYNWSRC